MQKEKFLHRYQNVLAWFKHNIWLILIIFVLFVNALLVYSNFVKPPSVQSDPIIEELQEPQRISPEGMVASVLNGKYVEEEVAVSRPFAVMIDNFVAARPTSGLYAASIVYETIVEGGVTRLLVVFQTDQEVTIGPVRSARSYFLPWVKGLQAIYAHSGGSPAALAVLREDEALFDADEFRYGTYYYRNSARRAPHNLYTSTSKLQQLAEQRKWNEQPSLTPIKIDDQVPEGEVAARVQVNISLHPYRTLWRYDEQKERYLRTVNGTISIDEVSKEAVGTENVVVLFTDVTPAPRPGVPDAVQVKTVGQGDALFFRDGVVTEGRWRKESEASRIEFLQTNNEPYGIRRGQVWVMVMDKNHRDRVTYE